MKISLHLYLVKHIIRWLKDKRRMRHFMNFSEEQKNTFRIIFKFKRFIEIHFYEFSRYSFILFRNNSYNAIFKF